VPDPFDCAAAAAKPSHLGCEFWPTVTANLVWNIFDFAIIVVNPGATPATVQVQGPNAFAHTVAVAGGASQVVYLPWVASLKGAETDNCGAATAPPATISQPSGAYQLTSSRAVGVYQFNPIEYKGVGGPPGKSWTSCPGNQLCTSTMSSHGCYSFSSDAALLLPTTSLTGSYRIGGPKGWSTSNGPVMPPYVVITATKNDTHVAIALKGRTVAGGGLSALNAGQTASVLMQAGDVLELVGGNSEADDLSGSLVTADKPVQVISGMPCRNVPSETAACDHLEEVVPPAQALGKKYVVTVPAGPNGSKAASQWVRLIGNTNGTALQFDPPISAPGINNGTAVLNAGSVLDLGLQQNDFQVTGDQAFMVTTFMASAGVVDPGTQPPDQKGDPSQSFVVPAEQLADRYHFAVPVDYELNFINVVADAGATVSLDGQPLSEGLFSAIGGTGKRVARIKLAAGGYHSLVASGPVGLQVYGYGAYTSYQMPGGSLAGLIAPAPTN
jgi:hypothetical protein